MKERRDKRGVLTRLTAHCDAQLHTWQRRTFICRQRCGEQGDRFTYVRLSKPTNSSEGGACPMNFCVVPINALEQKPVPVSPRRARPPRREALAVAVMAIKTAGQVGATANLGSVTCHTGGADAKTNNQPLSAHLEPGFKLHAGRFSRQNLRTSAHVGAAFTKKNYNYECDRPTNATTTQMRVVRRQRR